MKLTNFELASAVELSGLGASWDLHNCVEFAGLELSPEKGAASLRWEVMSSTPYREKGFSSDNPAKSCTIHFEEVKEIVVRRGESHAAGDDARTLSQVRLVAETRMLFEFISGFDIEIAAERATLMRDG